jgi:hypothetical protein
MLLHLLSVQLLMTLLLLQQVYLEVQMMTIFCFVCSCHKSPWSSPLLTHNTHKPNTPKAKKIHTNNTTLSISISLSSLLSQAHISLSSISQTHHLSFSPSPYVFLVFYLQNPSSLIFSISLLLFYLLNPSFLIFSMSLPCVLSPQLISLFLQSSKPISLGHGLS